ncbi:Lrp/AsnC family transcriptional regulator [Natronorubrum sp. A-ect3]|uniref:Lrp/AsnC family transcriptional regulator n=1 Tax=Natronorubrum sp. A-ect3 TaxID=3242698 RepID=UPI00359E2081
MSQVALDEVDRGILFLLQEDARNTTIAEIAENVDVSASTVRNRIEDLEETGVIEGYFPKINYELANYPLHVLFVCSAPADEREVLAVDALDRHGVVDVREMLTSTRNIHIEVIATDTRDLTEITNGLASMGFSIESSEIITNHHTCPWTEFRFNEDEEEL